MFAETKVYFDGSHYIAIPHTTRLVIPRPKPPENVITVVENNEQSSNENVPAVSHVIENTNNTAVHTVNEPLTIPMESKPQRKMTRKELFNELYDEHKNLSRAERKKVIINAMRPYFKCERNAVEFVLRNFERKLRNLICRRVRCTRKANLQEFNYFVTFTYDGKIHDEHSFKKKLKNCLSHFCSRKGWKYIGVWERSPEKQRLHFHAIMFIPDGTMPGFLIEVNDYNLKTHKRQITSQNTYFNENFGRSDFELIADRNGLHDAMAYLLKYIEKSGERIVYSKGLPQYFISDIMFRDIVCAIGQEDKKLLLFDDFNCWDKGQYMGRVSTETIKWMRKANN
jgi:hypothetical protein